MPARGNDPSGPAATTDGRRVVGSVGWWLVVAGLLLIVAGLAVAVSGDTPLARADADIVRTVADHRPGWLVDAARAVTLLGHGAILAVLLVTACVALVVGGVLPPRAALLPPIALAIAGGLNPVLKAIVDRPRPPVELRAVVEHSSGFPSGHSTQAASAWLTLALVLWLWGRGRPRWPLLAAAVLAGAVGITRVILAVHSPTDVLAGWCWGTAVALTVVGAAAYAERSDATDPAGSEPPTDGAPAAPRGSTSPPAREP